MMKECCQTQQNNQKKRVKRHIAAVANEQSTKKRHTADRQQIERGRHGIEHRLPLQHFAKRTDRQKDYEIRWRVNTMTTTMRN